MFSELLQFISKNENVKNKILLAFDFIIDMNEKENFRGSYFLNILSEISKEQKEVLSIIQSHKTDFKSLFIELIAPHVYLIFESAIIKSQLFSIQ